jgi:hypothetical protein
VLPLHDLSLHDERPSQRRKGLHDATMTDRRVDNIGRGS